jgi:hypothetical protein
MQSPRWLLAIGWFAAGPAIEAQATARDSTLPPGADAPTLSAASAGRARARVTARGGQVVGWVLSADDTLLVLQPDRRPFELWPRRQAAYDRRQLARLELSERPQWREQATALGVVIGAALGALIGRVALADTCPSGGQIGCNGRVTGVFVGGVIGLGVGGLLGRHVIGRDRWREIPPMRPRTGDLPNP